MHALAICTMALLFGFVGSMPLAGPISVMIISRAARKRFGDAYRLGIGAAVAEGMYATIAFWTFARLLSRHPLVVPVSHGVTAVILVGLGSWFVRWSPKDKKDTHQNKAASVVWGFSVSAINPTLLVTWSAAVAFLYSKGLRETSAAYALPFGVCAAVGVGGWCVLLVKILRTYQGKLPRKAFTIVVRSLGVVLVGLGVWSGIQFVDWLGTSRAGRAEVLLQPTCARGLLTDNPPSLTPQARPIAADRTVRAVHRRRAAGP
jgi:threonine/homoserine/homoserine lactone efflux protein